MEESPSMEIQLATASGGNEKKNEELVIEIKKIVERPEIQYSTQCRIYKVSRQLRKWKEEAYTPQVVSIGPFHHKNKRLKGMEEHKERYFRSFVERSAIKLEDFVGIIREMEEIIRGCYEETINLTSDRFVKMILVDASFILELLCKSSSESLTSDDPMAVVPRANAVRLDLLLLENQLPFFVIEKLHQLAFSSLGKSDPRLSNYGDLVQLSLNYFRIPCFEFRHDHPNHVNIEHFTDLLRTYQIPPLEKQPKRVHQQKDLLYTATQLHEAGVKFEVVTSECRFDIKFEKGVLKIPQLELDDWTEVVTRNIMALEQIRYADDTYFTDYFFLMNSLINTRKDVDFLREKKILVNYLSDNNAPNSMINNLNKGITWMTVRHDYIDIYNKLNSFYENPWHKRKATLKREYFGTPCRGASTVAVIILLVLTLIQTACSLFK
ncbi:hypothetical protein SO802_021957 [Lithocarpus litseifolius]|uniref:Uncharacterized protein n=1 Tax=Lithocarpus litseifolius TaxID=425828 RepID=A0AAW2CHM1_9ROSI